ncbi:MAG TPA: hypothetical protein VF939_00380 [Puia sp.]
MNKYQKENLKTIFLALAVILLTGLPDLFPWWTFLIPVLALGAIVTLRKWQVSAFSTGFAAGFIVWFGANMYFSYHYHDIILRKIGSMLNAPRIAVLLMAGVIGGLLTGLALYTGKAIVSKKIQQLPF